MKKKFAVISLFAILAIAIAACSPSSSAEQPSAAVDEAPAAIIEDVAEEPAAAGDAPAPAQAEFPAWYSAQLTDINTGAVFTVQDNIGKVYLVETMAIWCSKCLQQQNEVKRFHDLLGERDDFESLGINIDPNEDTVALTSYVRKNGFDWSYIVASNEIIDEISALYGPQFLNPPSTPMLIIDKQGNPHTLPFGVKSAEELLEAVQQYL